MTSRPESETTGLGPEAAARNVTGTATTGPAERFERGIETGTGVGRPVLASENLTAQPDVIGAPGKGRTGADKPIVAGEAKEREEPVVERRVEREVPVQQQQQTVLAWDQGTRGFGTALVQPVSLAHIPVIPPGNSRSAPVVKASDLHEAPGFPNREVGIPASEFRAAPGAVKSASVERGTGIVGRSQVEREEGERIEERERRTATTSEELPRTRGPHVVPPTTTQSVGITPAPVAPGIGIGLAPTSGMTMSSDDLSTRSVRSVDTEKIEPVASVQEPVAPVQGPAAMGVEAAERVEKREGAAGVAGPKPIVSEFSGPAA